MRSGSAWMAAAMLAVAGAAGAADAEPARKMQSKCPIMGGAIDRAQYADADGKRIFVCCAGCIGAVKKDFAAAAAKIEAAGEAVWKTQAQCPVMDAPVRKDLHVDAGGRRLYVCCAGCVEPAKKDAEKYIAQMEAAGIALDPAPAP